MAVYLGSNPVGLGGISSVIPSGYILPSGIYSINTGGIYNIATYASVDGNVPSPTGTYSINANGLYDIASYASVDVTVGATDIEDGLVTRTISGIYNNSRITQVGQFAFAYCSSLTSVDLPNVSILYQSAFASCYNLTTINIPNLTSMSSGSQFYNCYALKTVDFPHFPSTMSILSNTFGYCSSLINYNFNFSYISIISGAFSGCRAFTEVSKFLYTTILSGYTFYGCYNLVSVSFPAVSLLSGYVFYDCSSLADVSLPNLQTIQGSAFYMCRTLSQLSFPNLQKISGTGTFSGCYNLISLNLTGVSSVPILSNSNVFTSTPIGGYSASAGQYGSLYVPASLYDSFIAANNWSYFSSRIVSV